MTPPIEHADESTVRILGRDLRFPRVPSGARSAVPHADRPTVSQVLGSDC
jgi:hypothetical protein